ncbi:MULTISPECIES: hypothetical protein [unclassified Nocardioides]|uniref:hypothetical protein n=1 Tax=unclassified Nocardioides TaxID=2615069 RepID=UPI0026655903|nr:hypothetical protein [Nocardioides sp. Arc9.136]WKN47041.1 hypothetical protein OSR43_13435 [Nocardioides sp. Arc9.136]
MGRTTTPWRTTAPIPLAGVDEHCAVHQFIRVHGRRPTAEELARCQRTAPPLPVATGAAGPPVPAAGPAAAVTGRVRRDIARLIARI